MEKDNRPNILFLLNDHQVHYGHGMQGVRIQRPRFDSFAGVREPLEGKEAAGETMAQRGQSFPWRLLNLESVYSYGRIIRIGLRLAWKHRRESGWGRFRSSWGRFVFDTGEHRCWCIMESLGLSAWLRRSILILCRMKGAMWRAESGPLHWSLRRSLRGGMIFGFHLQRF